MHGYCTKERISRLIRDAHGLILPSHGENCPLAICEALTTGRPVVTTEAAGCSALVGPEQGVLAPVGDATALAEAVTYLVDNYKNWDWRRISGAAAETFSPWVVAERYATIFKRLIKSRDRGG